MEVVGEAGDGEEALELIQRLQPQIALVDINMPILNGLELAQVLWRRQSRTRIVFLTGYRDFEYAKQAVTYQVFDYLLKPISEEEIAATLTRLRREIEVEQQVTAHVRSIEQESDKGRRLLWENFLHQLAFGRLSMTESQLASQIRQLGLPLEAANLLALVVEIEPAEGDRDDGLYVYAVLNILCELLREEGSFRNVQGVSEIDSCAVVLCNVSTAAGAAVRVRQVWQRLVETVEAHFSFTMAGGVSGVMQGFSWVPAGVRAAMEAMGEKFYQDGNLLFFPGEMPEGGKDGSCFGGLDFEQLQMSIDSGEREEGARSIQELLERMRAGRVREDVYKMTALGLAAVLHSIAAKYHLPPDTVQADGELLPARIDAAVTCREVDRVLLECYNRLMDALQETRKVSKLVHAAQEYIKAHYASSELSLKEIAAGVFATPAYVSSLFKKEMGVSVTEYITICRMRKAAELLGQSPDSGLMEISERVGYTDPYYFSRCFKKYYGVTPSKFLSNHIPNRPPSGR